MKNKQRYVANSSPPSYLPVRSFCHHIGQLCAVKRGVLRLSEGVAQACFLTLSISKVDEHVIQSCLAEGIVLSAYMCVLEWGNTCIDMEHAGTDQDWHTQ